ncbi:histone H1-like [Metopolophium dirhodum]|uniref:histone H1-like n=1 Tax=Metopolophium dirhodum TaxID=44670 RepID=UPI0029904F89|nr:histone H1-like [Metopolophium dirhodum]
MSESGDDSSASTIASPQCSLHSSINSSQASSTASSQASSPPSSPTVVLSKSPIKKDLTVKRPTLAHPSTAVMVTTAIKSLKDKKGSTLPSIKKYMAINYQVDSAKFAPYIRRYLKSAITKGELIQTNGTGANGNFKLPAAEKKPVKKEKKPVAKKQAGVLVKKKPEAKKPIAKKTPTATSGKRRSIEGVTTTTSTTTAVSKAKKPKKVPTDVVKPKAKKTVEVAAKASPAKPKISKPVAKKASTKKVAPKKK